jgi:hypothetical protein
MENIHRPSSDDGPANLINEKRGSLPPGSARINRLRLQTVLSYRNKNSIVVRTKR